MACGSKGNGRIVGPDDLVGPFQPCDSMIFEVGVYPWLTGKGSIDKLWSHHGSFQENGKCDT